MDVLVIFILLQETKNPNLLDKNCTQENVKCHIQHEESWLRGIIIEQITSKTTCRLYFLEEIVLAHFQSLFWRYILRK